MSMKEMFMLRFNDGFAKMKSFAMIWYCICTFKDIACVCAAVHNNQRVLFKQDNERLLAFE